MTVPLSPMAVVSRVLLAAAMVAACVACSPLATTSSGVLAPNEDGAILARAACTDDTTAQAFAQAVENYYLQDILDAKLGPELAARPLASTFTYAEHLRLTEAAKAGRCERVMYRSSGLRVAGFVLRPATKGPHPVLIWLRGGNRDFGKIERVTLLNLQLLADAGFLVVATQYRGADGGEGRDEFGGADVDDVMSLLPLARSLPDADTRRLYLVGGSRGAMQGALAMRRGLPVKAVAFRGGVFDLKAAAAARPQFEQLWRSMMPNYDANRELALQQRSPLAWAGELRVPALIVHGREDWRSSVADAERFDASLARNGVARKLVIYERDEHQLALHRPEWLQEVVSWFRRHGAFDKQPSGQR